MLKDGFSGPLGLLRDYYPVDMHRAILTQAFEMGLSMAGQLWWRFLQYESFPRRLVGMIHPSLSKQSQYQYAVSFCALRSCCRDVHMGAKVHTLLPTPQALFKDSNFRKLLVMWVIAYKFTNMICERLLAQIRQACDGDNADIERVCASGLLSQALTDHRQLGREDPRYKTRSQLLEDGVPLKCAVKKSPGVPCSGFMTWFHKQEPSKYFVHFSLRGGCYFRTPTKGQALKGIRCHTKDLVSPSKQLILVTHVLLVGGRNITRHAKVQFHWPGTDK
jgi:hypothetical protein